MPRWRPLPEELDPQIREFTSQLRRLVDRSGMSVATVADRTGYSKSSWERYLGGRLLPPRGAAHALAKVTDTDIRHLETMWELAERAWSRAEMRHDVTMEAIRVAQAREALGEFWDEPAKGKKRGRSKDRDKNRDEDKNRGSKGAVAGEGEDESSAASAASPSGPHTSPSAPPAPPSASELSGGRATRAGTGTPPGTDTGSPPLDDETAMLRPLPGGGARGARQRVDFAGWGAADQSSAAPPAAGPAPAYGQGPAGAEPGGTGVERGSRSEEISGGTSGPATSTPNSPPNYPGSPSSSAGHGDPHDPARSSRKLRFAALFAGAAGAFAVIAVGVLMFGLPGVTDNSSASPTPSPTTSARDLPAGVKCQGKDCTGKDPEKMGCGGQNVKSSSSAFVGPSMVEVRYSEVCKAAWGRITGAAQGDGLKISAAGQAESDKVDATNDAYTEMVAVSSATEARACATLAAGTTGCTESDAAGSAASPSASTPPAASSGP